MKKNRRRLMSLLLAAVMILSLGSPAAKAEPAGESGLPQAPQIEGPLTVRDMDPASLNVKKLGVFTSPADYVAQTPDMPFSYRDVVRVSIFLDEKSTADAGYSLENVQSNQEVMAYRQALEEGQHKMEDAIEATTGRELKVYWNLTLLVNAISADVRYGDIPKILTIKGIDSVELETHYTAPEPAPQPETPQTALSTDSMIKANLAWNEGYSGVGSRIAILDTGIDIDHISFDPDAFMHSINEWETATGKEANLMTAEDIPTSGLKNPGIYINAKIPYAYNYAESGGTSQLGHMQAGVSPHGSHVAGIAAGNRYIKKDGAYVDAAAEYGAVGVAPDAQLLLMKVFDKSGAYTAGYMAAIEDAIVLGCDACNLSLGSSSQGFTWASSTYQSKLNKLLNNEYNKMVMTVSAGNQSSLVNTMKTDMYIDNIYVDTIGNPGSYLYSMTTANADNIGRTYIPLSFDGSISALYAESVAVNGGVTASPGTFNYVYIDAIGSPEEYAAADEALDLGGKFVIVNRGGGSTFLEKANNAIPHAPKALLIANNARGMVSMGLTGYEGDFSVLAIAKASADAIKEQASVQQITVGEQTVNCYTGTVTVTAGTVERQDARMNTSSSWGTSGSLILKPEITAPGGSILAAWGLDDEYPESGHEAFALKNGTSMAAPHVAGLTALAAQYQRENPMAERNAPLAEAYSGRAIIQSLIMSTATPMKNDGRYLSLLNQGAGLIDAEKAVKASSAVMIGDDAYLTAKTGGNKDGKVKVELGDDPERNGSYTFTVSVFNTSDEKLHFNTKLDLFTQNRYTSDGQAFMDLLTKDLSGYTTNFSWEYLPPAALDDHDVNQDGVTDPADAQAILDYLSGKISAEGLNLTAGEMDNVEGISSYDAHLLLAYLNESTEFAEGEIPAHGQRDLSVTLTLPASLKDQLLAEYPVGNYLEGFLYLTCDTQTTEGVAIADEHTVPVFGFLGNWTDPSMFDNTSYTDVLYGTDTKIPYAGTKETNYLTLDYGSGAEKFSGNPYMVEESFPAERLAVNSETLLNGFTYSQLRGASTIGWAVSRLGERGGNITEVLGSGMAAAKEGLYVSNGTFYNTDPQSRTIGETPARFGLSEGEFFRAGFYALPELTGMKRSMKEGVENTSASFSSMDESQFRTVLADPEMQKWIGEGAWIGYDFVVDDTAPEIGTPSLDGGMLSLSVTDNQNIAYLALMSLDGTIKYMETAPGAAVYNEEVDISRFMDEVEGWAALFAADYAGNEVAKAVKINNVPGDNPFEASSVKVTPESVTLLVGGEMDLTYEISPMTLEDKTVTWESTDPNVVSVDENGRIKAVGLGSATVKAIANSNNAVYGSCEVTVKQLDRVLRGVVKQKDGSAYFVSFNVNNPAELTKLSDKNQSAYDLRGALVDEDGTLYVNSMTSNRSKVYKVDTDSFDLTELSPVSSSFGANGIARGLSGGDEYGSMAYPYGATLYLGNLTSSTRNIGVAVISVGLSGGYGVGVATKSSSPTAASFYVVLSDGAIWTVDAVIKNGSRSFDSPKLLMNTGYESLYGSGDAVYHGQALYYDGEFLYWSHTMNDKSAAKLFAIDTQNAILYELGDFDADVQSVVALHEDGIAAPADKVVSSVSVEPKNLTLEVQAQESLSATVVHAGAANTAVTWSSEDENIATVDQNGLVTAVAEGTVIIKAVSEVNPGAVGRCEVRVIPQGADPNAVTAVHLNANAATLLVGAEVSLTAEVEPAEAEDKSVTWDSSAPTVVSVDADGRLKALAPGTATITVKSNADPTFSDTCVVTVKAADLNLGGIVTNDTGTYFSEFNVGDLSTVTAKHSDSKGSLSLLLRSAFVSEDGTLYAGTRNASNTKALLYKVDPVSFALTEHATMNYGMANDLAPGLTNKDPYGSFAYAYGARLVGGALENYTFSSGTTVAAGKDIFSIVHSEQGKYFMGLACSETSNNRASYYALDTSGAIWQTNIILSGTTRSFSALQKVVDTGIAVSASTYAYYSQSLFFHDGLLYWVHGLTNNTVELVVIDPASGLFYKLGDFPSSIHAVMGLYIPGDVAPPAHVPVTGVNVTPATLTLDVAQQQSLSADVLPADASNKNISWSSSDPAVASVDENGLVKAHAAGTATITATSQDDPTISGSCTVTVNAPTEPIPVTEVQLSLSAVTLLPGGKASLTATALPAEADNTSVSWNSDNTAVATVADGLVTAVAPGTATITAASESDPNVTAVCTITVKAADLTLNGIVRSDAGVFFSEFNVGNLSQVTQLHTDSKADKMLKGAFVANDGTLYAGDIDTNGNATNLYTVNTSDYSVNDYSANTYGANDIARAFSNYAYVDMAYVRGRNFYAGNIDTSKGKGTGKSGYPWIGSTQDSPKIEVKNTDNNYFVGIAEKVTNETEASFYLLDHAGAIWEVNLIKSGSATFADTTNPISKVVTTQLTVATNTGYGYGSTYQSQSMYFDGDLLYWVRGAKTGAAQLVVIDPESGVFNVMGSFPSDIHAVTGLHTLPGSNTGAKLPESLRGYLTSVQVEQKAAERSRDAVVQEAGAAAADSGYNITESETVTNGLLKITYDPTKTTLRSAESELEFHSIHVDETTGTITFAYAAESGLETGEVLINLDFSHCEESGATITTLERNGTLAISGEEEPINWQAEGHAWGEPAYEWTPKAGGGYTVTATLICAEDENHTESETVDATYEVIVPPVGNTPGTGRYTATFTREEFETQTRDESFEGEGIRITASVSMKENFNLNLYLANIPQEEASQYTVKWSFDGNLYGESFAIPLGDDYRQEDGRYKLTLEDVFAYQMSHLFHITVEYKGTEIKSFPYSVKMCLENRYAKNEDDKEVCRAALNYGAAAQAFFDGKSFADASGTTFQYNTNLPDHVTNLNLSEDDKAVNVEKPTNTVAASGTITGLTKKSASLILGTETSIKFYFRYNGEIGNLSFSVNNGKIITDPALGSDGRYHVIVKGIASYELHKDFIITIENGDETSTLTYSPYTYAAKYWEAADELTKNICHALVAFGNAAKALWPN